MDNTKCSNSTTAGVENLLKPCPFCGKTPLVEKNIKDCVNFYSLEHCCFTHKRGNYLACARIAFFGDTKKEVAELWNRRAGE